MSGPPWVVNPPESALDSTAAAVHCPCCGEVLRLPSPHIMVRLAIRDLPLIPPIAPENPAMPILSDSRQFFGSSYRL